MGAGGMKRRRLKIDWETLEEAFDSPPDELPAYLDRVTGRLVLDGEGEDDEARGEGGHPKDDGVRVFVRPPDLDLKTQWMEAYLEQASDLDPEVREELHQALDDPDPSEAVGEVWRARPVEREAWFAYRADRLHELIESWLSEVGIEPMDPPPWRS